MCDVVFVLLNSYDFRSCLGLREVLHELRAAGCDHSSVRRGYLQNAHYHQRVVLACAFWYDNPSMCRTVYNKLLDCYLQQMVF